MAKCEKEELGLSLAVILLFLLSTYAANEAGAYSPYRINLVTPSSSYSRYEWKWTILAQGHAPKYGRTEATT